MKKGQETRDNKMYCEPNYDMTFPQSQSFVIIYSFTQSTSIY